MLIEDHSMEKKFIGCFESCETCSTNGDDNNHNCKSCKYDVRGIKYYKSLINENNCYFFNSSSNEFASYQIECLTCT